MHQISFYQTSNIFKSICQLLEKCYLNKLNTVLITSAEQIEEIDKLLWTYARRGFLPHGTKNDPFPEKQPIYISDMLENPNNAQVLMLTNKYDLALSKSFSRIIIIYDEAEKDTEYQIQEIKSQVINSGDNVTSYKQNALGGWIKQ